MSIMIDLPPAIEQEAKGYVVLDGMPLEQIVLACMENEFARRRVNRAAGCDDWESQFDELVKKSSEGMKGTEPYAFNRADAYPEGEFA